MRAPSPTRGSAFGAWPWLLVLVMLAGSIYARNLDDYFTGDDFDLIQSFYAQPPRYLLELLVHDESGDVWTYLCQEPGSPCPDPARHGFLRPLKIWLLALDFALWGVNPTGYHVTGTVLFAANVVLAFLLLRLLPEGRAPVAFLGAAIVALYPLFAEVVPSITYREETLATALGLGALYAHLRHRLHGGSALWFHALYAAALLTKESAVSVVGLAVGWDAVLAWRDRPQADELRRRLRTYLPTVGVLAAYFLLRLVAFGNFVGGHGETDYLDPARLLAFHATLFRYLFTAPVFAFAGVGLAPWIASAALLALLATVLVRRRRLDPGYLPALLFLGPVWYVASTAVAYGVYFSPRHIVLPILGLILFGAYLVGGVGRVLFPRSDLPAVALGLVLGAAVFLPPTVAMSRRFEEASRAVASMRAEIERQVTPLSDGSRILVVDAPERRVYPPPYFGHALQSALNRPFSPTDLARRRVIRSVSSRDLAQVSGEPWDLVLRFAPAER